MQAAKAIFQRTVAGFVVANAVLLAQWSTASEFRVNTYTTESQFGRALAGRANGEYVAVWSSFQDARQGVYAQRLTAVGERVGSEFLVNSYTSGSQLLPRIGADGSGGFVIVWTGEGDGNGLGVFARRYDAAAAPVGPAFQVNTYTTGYQVTPDVAVNPDGSFVVAWPSFGQDGSDNGVFAQRFDSGGARAGAEFRVNTGTARAQDGVAVDADATGRFVVAWQSQTNDPANPRDVFAQRFAANGTPLGTEMSITPNVTAEQDQPSVAVSDSGAFVVVWRHADYQGTAIRARRFDDQGNDVGPELTINTRTGGFHETPAAAFDRDGNLLVAWSHGPGDGDTEGIFAQRFAASGTRRGGEFRVNSYTPSVQWQPALASAGPDTYMVTWSSFGQDGDLYGVFGESIGTLQPSFLRVDVAGNGVFEAGESAAVSPAWQNMGGPALAFRGTVASFSGPGAPNAPTYSIVDGAADYGLVAAGAISDCGATSDCYQLATTVAATRPSLHWDATFHEDLVPGAAGRSKDWTLHVGETFADVPTTNGFYRFVETLVHAGVTAGCQAGSFCPTQPTSREAMSVFVLVSREGRGYVPPPCGPTAMFTDVPRSSPFCPWVEELARRGVASGCGSGRYCPAQAATREQMAVFVLRALDPVSSPAPCVPPNQYADVPESSPFCPWIEELTVRGIVSGCGGGNYCPTAPVTREQMSTFLTVTFGLALYGP
jgi:hypothetical protein